MMAQAGVSDDSQRLVLEGVPRIGFDRHLSPFPGSLYALLEYVGDLRDYDFLMGTSGAAFRRFWNRDDGGNVDLCYLGQEAFRRVFEAIGYGWRAIPPERDAMLAAIRESLARGVPCIGFGLVGPPEAGLVTGYARGGQALVGWSFFQPDSSRYYELEDWFAARAPSGEMALIVVEGKLPAAPSPREVLARALAWALDVERTAQRSTAPAHAAGLAACAAWADGLEVDADYPPADDAVMGVRTMVYGDQCVMLEERRNAARFLRQLAAAAPEAVEQLDAAARHFEQVAELMSSLWPWPADSYARARAGLVDAAQRRALAAHVRRAGALEAQAVAHLERALAALAG